MCLPKVLHGRWAVYERLGGAELEQNIDSLVVGGWLGERATEIRDRVLRRPAGAGTARGLAEAVDDGGVRGGRNEQQMSGDPFRLRVCCSEQLRRTRVRVASLDQGERVVDGSTYERVDELERGLRTQDVDTREVGQRLRHAFLVEAGDRGGLVRRDLAAENRHRLREAGRLGWEAGEARPESGRAGPGRKLAQARNVDAARRDVLGEDPVAQLPQEQRIAARDLVAGCAEGVVCVRRQRLAHEAGGCSGTERSGLDDRRLRVGDDLRQELRSLACLFWSKRDDQRDFEAVQPPQQVSAPAPRGAV